MNPDRPLDHARQTVANALSHELLTSLLSMRTQAPQDLSAERGMSPQEVIDWRHAHAEESGAWLRDRRVRQTRVGRVLDAITAFGRPVSPELIRDVLVDDAVDDEVRVAAARALLTSEDGVQDDIVLEVLTSRGGSQRFLDALATTIASEAPQRLRGPLIDQLANPLRQFAERMSWDPAMTQAEMMDAWQAARRGPPAERERMRRAAKDARASKAAIVTALAGYSGSDVDDALRRVVDTDSSESGDRALRHLGPRARVDQIDRALSDITRATRFAAVANGTGLALGDVSFIEQMDPADRARIIERLETVRRQGAVHGGSATSRDAVTTSLRALHALGRIDRDELRSIAASSSWAHLGADRTPAFVAAELLCDGDITPDDIDIIADALFGKWEPLSPGTWSVTDADDPHLFERAIGQLPAPVRDELAERARQRSDEAMASVAEIAPYVSERPLVPGTMSIALEPGLDPDDDGFIEGTAIPVAAGPTVLYQRLLPAQRAIAELAASGTPAARNEIRAIVRRWTEAPVDDGVYEAVAMYAMNQLREFAEPGDRDLIHTALTEASPLARAADLQPDAQQHWQIQRLTNLAQDALRDLDRRDERSTLSQAPDDVLYERVVDSNERNWADTTEERITEAVEELTRRGRPIDEALLRLASAGTAEARFAAPLLAANGRAEALASLANNEHAPLLVRAAAAGLPAERECRAALERSVTTERTDEVTTGGPERLALDVDRFDDDDDLEYGKARGGGAMSLDPPTLEREPWEGDELGQPEVDEPRPPEDLGFEGP